MEAKAGFTQDGTVDLHGRPVLASKTGKWKACAFLVGNHLLDLFYMLHDQNYSCKFRMKEQLLAFNFTKWGFYRNLTWS